MEVLTQMLSSLPAAKASRLTLCQLFHSGQQSWCREDDFCLLERVEG